MRIAIVNDTAMVAEALRRIIMGTKEHDVAWIAADGAAAVANCRLNRPDLILMDIEMPVMDGVEATRQIMANTPCAILVVTETLNRRAAKVFECLGAGALDAMKLSSVGADLQHGQSLLGKLKILARLIHTNDGRVIASESTSPTLAPCPDLIVIGASAGGPDAVATVLEGLPSDFSAGIIVVQHIDQKFVGSLATWLEQRSSLPIRLAREGDTPQCGVVLLADSQDHLRFTSPTRLAYTREPADSAYRPSIDVLFESAARCWRDSVIGVLLTGMGHDGAKGLKALADTGAATIAQDAASSVVYGMPKAAVALGAAGEVLSIKDIAPRLTGLIKKSVA